MSALDEIKLFMTSIGWERGGSPGSVKLKDNKIVAIYSDDTWWSDLAECRDRNEMAAYRISQECRAALHQSKEEETP